MSGLKEAKNIYEQGLMEQVMGRTLRPGGYKITEEALGLCAFPKDAAILDIGCGSGATVQLLRKKYSLDARGLDISKEMIRRGKNICSELPLVHGDAHRLPFANNELQGVFLECSFSLFSEQQRVLAEINRVLKKDGKIVISDFYYRQRPGKTKPDIIELIEKSGFKVDIWLEKSEHLHQLVADCILNDFSLDLLWCCMLNKEENKGCTKEEIKKWKPGYFLLIASKC
ncbi:MAG: class I SAM-dependent methyltransferase [Peptococcaceae bacterium]|jgi:arsenite methyltransferase|nr:class I SAM-dependent methyltransferase [Peptococcaceae bacterium]